MILKCFALFLLIISSALGVEFRAEVDREEVAQDESLSMKLVIEADGTVPVETPEFSAPNFDELQNYQGSSVQSYYDSNSGKFGAKFTRSFTYVLRPKSTGRLSITNIKIKVNGQSYAANPITVVVTGGGSGTPPPQGYGGAGSGLRGAAKKSKGTTLFLRTEVDKVKAYRGQQIVVNYYLYSRARSFNASADRYPNLNGFLKEELDIPVLRGQLTPQEVILDGTKYRRVLIASFAAYPLKEGKLSIDPMEVKATYIEERRIQPGGNIDPFGDEDDLFQRFFQQGAPRTESLRSETITVEVLPVTEVPRDINYTGAVGDFDVVSAVDRTDLKAHEALSLTLKVEGTGNLSNIETPKIPLPDGFELYEAKSQTKGKAGMGEKIFEYLLIPRKAGDFTLPSIGLGFFDPKKGQYVQKTTEAIRIHVNEGDPGAENQAPVKLDPTKELASPEKGVKRVFDLFSGSGNSDPTKPSLSRAVSGRRNMILIALTGIIIAGLLFRYRRRLKKLMGSIGADARKKKALEAEWSRVRRQAEEAQRLPFPEVVACFAFIEGQLEEALSQRFGIAARGLTRAELKERLVDQGQIPENLWQRLSALLELTETLRFASQSGVVSEERARNELKKWIAESEQILQKIRES